MKTINAHIAKVEIGFGDLLMNLNQTKRTKLVLFGGPETGLKRSLLSGCQFPP
jgi:hypothetical protein